MAIVQRKCDFSKFLSSFFPVPSALDFIIFWKYFTSYSLAKAF